MTHSFDEALQGFLPQLPMAVAFSGGADSTALLVACAEKWPGQVEAWHINHGLQAAALAFETHCQALCTRLQVPLRVSQVDANALPGHSPEDAARRARYQAFRALSHTALALPAIKSVAIAQHANDQVETLLLALSRGAGLAGLSAMPAHWQREGIDFYRPLLRVPAFEIRRWLAARDLPFCEDPTNTDLRFTRNRIRAQIMPALEEAFPQCLDTFCRSATHAVQGQLLLDELALLDWHAVSRDDQLPMIRALQTLSGPRQANVVRYWLKTQYREIPSTAQLAQLQHQIAACTTRGHRIHIKVGTGFVERKGAVLTWYNP